MQRTSGQYDHLARTRTREGSGGWSLASWNRCRAAPRRAPRMEPTVRNPRIESELDPARSNSQLRTGVGARLLNRKFRTRGTEFFGAETGGQNQPERPLL